MDHQFYSLTISEVLKETPDCITIRFTPSGGFPTTYLAGQFLTIKAEIDGKSERRSYSLCSSPATDALPAISVKAVEGGIMSNWLLKNATPGRSLEVMPPIGNFIYQPHHSRKRWFMLYAAGSGITPIFSILKTILATEPQSFVSLMVGNRTLEDIIYKTELERLATRYPARLKVLHTLSQPDANWYGHRGRIDEVLIHDSLEYLKPVTPFEETHVYMCGPNGMMETIAYAASNQGVKKENIHRESFTATVDELAKMAAATTMDIQKRVVTILLDGERYEVEVPPESTILEAALDMDIDMPYSCQSGLCTACRGKCLKGKVHMDEREGLDDQDIEEGFVLTCVARPLTAGVEIEMG